MKKPISLFEISLLVMATVAFSYMVAQDNTQLVTETQSDTPFIIKIRKAILDYLGSNLASAAEGLWTCPVTNTGSTCQEFPPSTCQGVCNQTCFPGPRTSYAECAVGTCIDPVEGTCSPAPRATCLAVNGTWKTQSPGELAECRPGCCLLGSQASFINQRQCTTLATRLGIESEFRNVPSELACLVLANPNVEGACVLVDPSTEERGCKFTTQQTCVNTLRGEFHENTLCSNPSLNTICTKQERTSCVEGKDEVYWMDSCGNRENIFDTDTTRSWNNGLILRKEQSCSLGSLSNLFGNQGNCGNCNYLQGSVCGTPRPGIDTKPIGSDVVCRDLSCTEADGSKRKHGESWCAFDSQIGPEGAGNGKRSVDVPGSSHYRQICLNGEIRTESCQSGRKEVCVESRNENIDFSSAACRINQWQQCIEANANPTKMTQCRNGELTDCYAKQVAVSGQFSFDRCVPKYPPGFDLQATGGGETAETICAFGTQQCTYVKIRRIGKSKRINVECTGPIFAESMNNLCMSLGDCGASVNIVGDYSGDGYRVWNTPGLGPTYIEKLRTYIYPKEGQKVDPLSEKELAILFGLDTSDPSSSSQEKFGQTIATLGAGATGVVLASYIAQVGFTTALSSLEAGAGISYGTFGPGLEVFSAQLGPFGTAAAGALVGGAMGFLVAKLFGLQGDAITATVVAGIVGGAAITYLGAAGTGGAVGGTSFFAILSFTFLLWTAVIVVVVAILMVALGIGKASKTTVEFQCLPWQPPKGGASCEECGANGLPCNRYKCESLGQACSFIEENEGTTNPLCVHNNPKDVSAPIIKPNPDVLLQNYSYTNISEAGFKIQGTDVNGCLPAYSVVQLGITTDEVAQCKIDAEHTSSYDEMESFFGGTNLFSLNHTMAFPLPSLEAISAGSGSAAFNTQKDLNLYVRCSDMNGNSNLQEYAINFCMSPQDDITPPAITGFDPETPAVAAFNASQHFVEIFTNEPAECKWSTADQAYEFMTNEAECLNEIEDITLRGWMCNATLPITSQQNAFYFRCNDQPWVEDNSSRNSNTQSVIYDVRRSQEALRITSVSPNNITLVRGGLPIEVNLTVRTGGGATGANRFCEFGWGGQYTRFFQSGTDLHIQPRLVLYENRTYTIPIRCRDDAGNQAQSSAVFGVFVDRAGPQITRIYNQNSLHVITDEPAVCSYSILSCDQALINGTALSGIDFDHTLTFTRNVPTFITCRDRYGNQGMCFALQGGDY